MKKIIYIVLFRVFGRIPKNGELKEYIQNLYDKREWERERKYHCNHMMEKVDK